MSLAGADEEKTGGGEDESVEAAERRESDRQRHDPGEHAQHSLAEGHGDRIRAKNLLRGEDGKVCQVGKEIDDGDQRNRDVDRSRQVAEWIFKFFSNEVEIVPARVRIEAGVKRQSDSTGRGRGALKAVRVFEIL